MKKSFDVIVGHLVQMSQSFLKKENVQFAMLMLFVMCLVVLPDSANAANPLEVMKGIFRDQAEENVFPVLIIWTLIIAVLISFGTKSWYPFIFGIIACVIIAISPEIAPNFNSTNITPATGGW